MVQVEAEGEEGESGWFRGYDSGWFLETGNQHVAGCERLREPASQKGPGARLSEDKEHLARFLPPGGCIS